MSWYQSQFNIDAEEEFEMQRYMAEYNAMFGNPDGVRRVREAREKTISVPDKDFEETVSELFGRELPKEKQAIDLKEFSLKNEKEEKINEYLDMNLDEIKFIPFDGE